MKYICDWNDCKEIGAYKAPVEKDNSKKFRMLCLEHVKEFNKNWNYFSDMNDEEVINFLKSDIHGINQHRDSALQIIFLRFYGIMY